MRWFPILQLTEPCPEHVLFYTLVVGLGLISVNTCTLEAITDPSWSTVTFEASSCVGAGSVSVAVMGSNLTLVYI